MLKKTRGGLRLVDTSGTPSGTFFLEVCLISEMAYQNHQIVAFCGVSCKSRRKFFFLDNWHNPWFFITQCTTKFLPTYLTEDRHVIGADWTGLGTDPWKTIHPLR